MGHTIEGACHCGNISFALTTKIAAGDIQARACDCRFCRIHAAKNWSDPDGSAVIRVAEERLLQKYRFALKTADFYICGRCGTYAGAILADHERMWSTLNLRLCTLDVADTVASFGGENISARVARRKRVWTPTRIILEH